MSAPCSPPRQSCCLCHAGNLPASHRRRPRHPTSSSPPHSAGRGHAGTQHRLVSWACRRTRAAEETGRHAHPGGMAVFDVHHVVQCRQGQPRPCRRRPTAGMGARSRPAWPTGRCCRATTAPRHADTLRLETELLGRASVAAHRVGRQCLRHAGIAHGRRQRTAAVTKSDAAASAVTRAGAGLAFCTTPATMAHPRQCPAPAPLAAAGCASAPPPITSYSVTRLPASSACRPIRSRRAAYSARCASSTCR